MINTEYTGQTRFSRRRLKYKHRGKLYPQNFNFGSTCSSFLAIYLFIFHFTRCALLDGSHVQVVQINVLRHHSSVTVAMTAPTEVTRLRFMLGALRQLSVCVQL
jgi:hypothetical protein